MVCDVCGNKTKTGSAVVGGEYIPQICHTCLQRGSRTARGDSAQYNRDRDREDHRRDIIQPYTKRNTPNRSFIEAYPNKAKDYFNSKELRQSGV